MDSQRGKPKSAVETPRMQERVSGNQTVFLLVTLLAVVVIDALFLMISLNHMNRRIEIGIVDSTLQYAGEVAPQK